MSGSELIAAERQRQQEQEGWTPDNDDGHDDGQLAQAAKAYLSHALLGGTAAMSYPSGWPWDEEWWKPSDDPVRNLVKAGALIAAEIDRIQRLV